MILILPWPNKHLSPNARIHWSVRSRAVRAYRKKCREAAEKAGITAPGTERIRLLLEFLPPDRRDRDDDNMIGRFKPGRDGLADALGVDDKRFKMAEPVFSDSVTPGGAVVVQILGDE